MKVLIAGPGTIGASLALGCVLHGHETTLLGRREESLERGRERMRRGAGELAAAGLLPAAAGDWEKRVAAVTSLRAVDPSMALVIEAIDEKLEAKQGMFADLEAALSAETVFASSTSGLPVDALAEKMTDPSRLAVAHFANPPHLMPMVEVVPGSATRAEVMDFLADFVRSIGKTPARLKRDIPGHLFNRIQFAMLREAMALVAAEVASAEEIDTVVKRGLALRLAEEGPLEKIDLAGVKLVHDVASYLFPDLDCATEPALLAEMLAAGQLGADAGRGFYTWDTGRADAVLARRNAEVIRHLKRLQA